MRTGVVTAVIVAALCALGLAASDYLREMVTLVLIYSIAVIGLGFLTGFAGRISLAQGALYGIGAYAAALLVTRTGLQPLIGLPVAILAAAANRHGARRTSDPAVRPLLRHVHDRDAGDCVDFADALEWVDWRPAGPAGHPGAVRRRLYSDHP
jgi:hypothetical protein